MTSASAMEAALGDGVLAQKHFKNLVVLVFGERPSHSACLNYWTLDTSQRNRGSDLHEWEVFTPAPGGACSGL
jgi:hypothetical protein